MVGCGEMCFAIQADAVRTVMSPDEGDLDAVLASFGIKDLPVHLAERFGLTGSYLSPESRIVVYGMQGTYLAVRVDRVLGLHDVDSTKVRPLLPHFIGPERRWIAGMFLFQQTVVPVLHTGWLLSDDRGSRPSGTAVLELAGDRRPFEPSRPTVVDITAARRESLDWNGMNFEEVTDADDTPWAQI